MKPSSSTSMLTLPYSNFGQNTYKNGAYANTGLTFNIESDYHFMRWNYYLGRQGYYIGAAAVTSIAYTKNPFNTKKYVENQLTYMGKHLMSLETEAKGYQLLDLMIGIKLKAIYKRSTYPYFKCMFGAIHIVKGAMQTNGKTTDDEGITIDYFDYKIKNTNKF